MGQGILKNTFWICLDYKHRQNRFPLSRIASVILPFPLWHHLDLFYPRLKKHNLYYSKPQVLLFCWLPPFPATIRFYGSNSPSIFSQNAQRMHNMVTNQGPAYFKQLKDCCLEKSTDFSASLEGRTRPKGLKLQDSRVQLKFFNAKCSLTREPIAWGWWPAITSWKSSSRTICWGCSHWFSTLSWGSVACRDSRAHKTFSNSRIPWHDKVVHRGQSEKNGGLLLLPQISSLLPTENLLDALPHHFYPFMNGMAKMKEAIWLSTISSFRTLQLLSKPCKII